MERLIDKLFLLSTQIYHTKKTELSIPWMRDEDYEMPILKNINNSPLLYDLENNELIKLYTTTYKDKITGKEKTTLVWPIQFSVNREKMASFIVYYAKNYPHRLEPFIHIKTQQFISNFINNKISNIKQFLRESRCDEELINLIKSEEDINELVNYLSYAKRDDDHQALKNIIQNVCHFLFNKDYILTTKELNNYLRADKLEIETNPKTDIPILKNLDLDKIIWEKNYIKFGKNIYTPNTQACRDIVAYCYEKIKSKNKSDKIQTSFTLKGINSSVDYKIDSNHIENFRRGTSGNSIPIKINNRKGNIIITEI